VPRRRFSRLKLGPIVGHTTDSSSTVWIQAFDDPSRYALRVHGAGLFPFASTEAPGPLEFCTGIAVAQNLRPDWRYTYSVLRNGRVVQGARGTFRTMPLPGSIAPILFCPISCNSAEETGAWDALKKFVDDAKPHFLLMMGDQVYIDDDKPNVFDEHHDSPPAVRRKALAEKYRANWSREQVRHVLSHVPTYMMWDDHEIRDGWGSLAADSPTMVQKIPRGQAIFDTCDAFYRDARDVYWHFQACHNPPPPAPFHGPPFGERTAFPYAFQCGRVVALMVDSRGQRDVFRKDLPALGLEQWTFIDQVLSSLPEDVDALVVMTPTPIASLDPHGASQKLVGGRTDDIEAFRRGDFNEAVRPFATKDVADLALAAVGSHLSRLFGGPVNLGNFKVNAIDEARDQWSHAFVRPEQALVLTKAARARLVNRSTGSARALVFVSGDIHVGCIFDITIDDPQCKVVSLTSSGVSTIETPTPVVGSIVDDEFAVASGIHSKLREIVTEFNFGVVQVIPTGVGAEIVTAVAHKGNAFAVGLDIADLL
jgi:PhoD-like phosphatase